jgi:DNA uptake protein ComE-like DNA-binding protein
VIEKIKDYFQFNKKERNGILLLSFLLFILVLIYQFSHLLKEENETDFSDFKQLISNLEYKEESSLEQKKDTLFYFNPNTLSDEGWFLLGLTKNQLKTLRNFQEKAGEFKNKQELKKCFAITDEFFIKVRDYISIPKKKIIKKVYKPKEISKVKIEINSADSLILISIKGIGPFYAKQILKYRRQLGGFTSYNQLKEVWGLDKLNLESFKSQTEIDTLFVKKININTINLDGLKLHPYLHYKEAKMIISYRNQHGSYSEVKDIRKIRAISPELFRKIAPYLETHD